MILLGVSFLVLALDQFTKFLVLQSLAPNESAVLWPGYLYFTYVQNPGTAFGFMSDMQTVIRIPFFIAVAIAAGLIVYTYQKFVAPEKHLVRVGLGLVWGGALGNLVDRIFYGKVVDFIDLRYHDYPSYVFNVADSCAALGVLILFVEFIRGDLRGVKA